MLLPRTQSIDMREAQDAAAPKNLIDDAATDLEFCSQLSGCRPAAAAAIAAYLQQSCLLFSSAILSLVGICLRTRQRWPR